MKNLKKIKKEFSELSTIFDELEGPENETNNIIDQNDTKINIVEKNGNAGTGFWNNYFDTKDNDNKEGEELFRVKRR